MEINIVVREIVYNLNDCTNENNKNKADGDKSIYYSSHIWPCSPVLSQYIVLNDVVKNKNILELGCGTTILPSILSYKLGANIILSTDSCFKLHNQNDLKNLCYFYKSFKFFSNYLKDGISKGITEKYSDLQDIKINANIFQKNALYNLDANNITPYYCNTFSDFIKLSHNFLRKSLYLMPLIWGDIFLKLNDKNTNDETSAKEENHKFDVILASDIFYDGDNYTDIMYTLKNLALGNKNVQIFITYQRRDSENFGYFYNGVSRQLAHYFEYWGFLYERIELDESLYNNIAGSNLPGNHVIDLYRLWINDNS
ncbi:unnamed protein product [Gordionus sp. m RMFG-2023]|uniref:uncharacterized protein LOC135926718 n=1 Tax=Gordionus sp. m RMFG-2023 TaxID=3053472 RepID=UPI0030E07343